MSKKTSKSGFNKIKKANGTIFLNSHVVSIKEGLKREKGMEGGVGGYIGMV